MKPQAWQTHKTVSTIMLGFVGCDNDKSSLLHVRKRESQQNRMVLGWLLLCMFDTAPAPTAQDKRRHFSDALSKLRKTLLQDMLNGTLSDLSRINSSSCFVVAEEAGRDAFHIL